MIGKRLFLACAAAAAMAASSAGCSHRIAGAQPRTWELRGAVVDATDAHVRVRHKTGQVIELMLDDRTQITRDERPRGRDILRRGARVRVEVEPLPEGGQRAQTIRVYGGARD
jgi:hypothetical protein